MATAGPEGCIQIYQVDKEGIAKKGGGLSHLTEIALSETSLVSDFIHFMTYLS